MTAPLGPDGLPMQVDERWVQNFYEEFYGARRLTTHSTSRHMMYLDQGHDLNMWGPAEDVFEEVAQFGEIENLNVCDNIADHMVCGWKCVSYMCMGFCGGRCAWHAGWWIARFRLHGIWHDVGNLKLVSYRLRYAMQIHTMNV